MPQHADQVMGLGASVLRPGSGYCACSSAGTVAMLQQPSVPMDSLTGLNSLKAVLADVPLSKPAGYKIA